MIIKIDSKILTLDFCSTTSSFRTDCRLSRKNWTRPLVAFTSPVAWLIGLPISKVSLLWQQNLRRLSPVAVSLAQHHTPAYLLAPSLTTSSLFISSRNFLMAETRLSKFSARPHSFWAWTKINVGRLAWYYSSNSKRPYCVVAQRNKQALTLTAVWNFCCTDSRVSASCLKVSCPSVAGFTITSLWKCVWDRDTWTWRLKGERIRTSFQEQELWKRSCGLRGAHWWPKVVGAKKRVWCQKKGGWDYKRPLLN